MRRHAAAVLAVAGTLLPLHVAHAQWSRGTDPPPLVPRAPSPDAPAAARTTFDPLVPGGIVGLGGGGALALAGLLTTSSTSGDDTVERCGLSGCIETGRAANRGDYGLPLLAGGGTSMAGGLALMLVAAGDPATHADAGRARVATGGAVMSLGAGLAVTGLTARASGLDGVGPDGLLATGLVATAVGAPFLAIGAATWDEDPEGSRYASAGRMIAGTALTGGGVLATAAGFGALATGFGCSGLSCGLAQAASIPLFAIGAGAVATGIPLLATGAQLDDTSFTPAVAVGPTSIDATWRFR